MNQEKRLPQVGEKWWMRDGRIADIVNVLPSGAQPVQTKNERSSAQSHARGGEWISPGLVHNADLILIHSDATGKVINPEFSGGVPMAPEKAIAKIIKETIAKQALREAMEKVKAAQECEAGIRAILALDAKMKALTGERAELAAKWLPKAGKVRK